MAIGGELAVLERLRALVGDDQVLTGEDDLAFFSTDLSFEPLERAAAVVRPGTVAELAACVREATSDGHPVVARGGGMSYTMGFEPSRPGSILLDLRRLDRIIDVNLHDMTVTAEAGVTWERLFDELRAQGVRTPYYGPISGRHATIGGTLSQNSLFYGSARYGMAADWVTSLDVVLADGSILTTGSGAHLNGSPFFRWLGPDLSSLFLGDTGAFGVKATATFQLIPFPEATVCASFGFDTLEHATEAMRLMVRHELAAELYCLDRHFHESLARMGLDFLRDVPWSLHVAVDAASDALAESALDVLRPIGLAHGREIDPATAVAVRADAFGGFSVLGDEGEVWVPIHCFLPWSKAQSAFEATRRTLDAAADRLAAVGMATSTLTTCARNAFVFEPCFWWLDEVDPLRLETIDADRRRQYGGRGPNPQARALYVALRRALADAYAEIGAAHIQIGKYYPFQSVLRQPSFDVLGRIKTSLDPDGLMNPGALELG